MNAVGISRPTITIKKNEVDRPNELLSKAIKQLRKANYEDPVISKFSQEASYGTKINLLEAIDRWFDVQLQ